MKNEKKPSSPISNMFGKMELRKRAPKDPPKDDGSNGSVKRRVGGKDFFAFILDRFSGSMWKYLDSKGNKSIPELQEALGRGILAASIGGEATVTVHFASKHEKQADGVATSLLTNIEVSVALSPDTVDTDTVFPVLSGVLKHEFGGDIGKFVKFLKDNGFDV